MKTCEHGRILERCYPCREAAGIARVKPAPPASRIAFVKDDLLPGVAFTKVGVSGAIVHAVTGATDGEGLRICSGGKSSVVEGSVALVSCVSCKAAIRDA